LIQSFLDSTPQIDPTCFVAPSAVIIGDVVLGARSSVWYNVTIRGDVNRVRIGSESNIQDNAVVHVTSRTGPTQIGNRVTVGHGAIIHGCTIRDVVLVGMGSIILDGAEIGSESLIGAGTLITQGMHVPPRSLVLGSPGKVVRSLEADEVAMIRRSAENYVRYAAIYRGAEGPSESLEDPSEFSA